MERIFSTRELAQMWNVSESTVKRWADSRHLLCTRTPGGHRRFKLKDIQDFQNLQGFEATGLLQTQEWEDPNLEELLNKKNFGEVGQQLYYLAFQNQREQIKDLLVRLLLRGVSLPEIFDKVLYPVSRRARKAQNEKELSSGQLALLQKNIEEALYHLYSQITQREANGKTALCATPDSQNPLAVTAIARLLEVEGWESLNLGNNISLAVMAEMVELEPVNLVCVVSLFADDPAGTRENLSELVRATENFRIPLLLYGDGFSALQHDPDYTDLCYDRMVTLCHFVTSLGRSAGAV